VCWGCYLAPGARVRKPQGLLTASPMLLPLDSPSLDISLGREDGDLISVVDVRQCASLVVPSEGKQVLGMGLAQMVKALHIVEEAGQYRGEERMPGRSR
jgi:hypothetical protein